ncbi:MAG: polysaccharide biosynthesis C-terminal domain-containing protein [Bacteroidales bacterium]|nr:polysaccharide biosynthesis C-terminal domain-containing protein [Bacteroidales bacterium]MCF8326678.1 polysaccharide biosynthesis C-terminal domain-containing protein [Bacteroidales bacterium]
MSQIFKQSAKNSIYIYIGVLLGFVITGVLYPELLAPEQIGLINVLIGYSVIIGKIGGLGMQQVTIRLFPYFRDEENKHHGFLALVLLITAAGFVLIGSLYLVFKDVIVAMGKDNSGLFVQYVDLILPLVLFSMLFNLLDNYYKVLYDAVTGTFYQEVVKRVFILVAILLYYFNVYDFQGFVYGYVLIAAVPFIALGLSLKLSNRIYLKTEFSYLTPKLRKEITDVAAFGLLAGTSGLFVMHIDKIMVLNLTNSLKATGIYSIAFFFGALVHKPARALMKVSAVYISEAWKKNNLVEINNLYKKSANNQMLIGLLLFVGLMVNLDNIFEFLDEAYQEGRIVIVLIALSFLFDMMGGVNGQIINTSKYYRWQTYLLIILVVCIVLFNWLLIPVYGIAGAALATLLAKVLFNLTKFLFIYFTWRFQPFNIQFLKIILIGTLSFLAGWYLPRMDNYIIDIIVRSTLTAAIYGFGVLILRPSVDVEYWKNKFRKRYF